MTTSPLKDFVANYTPTPTGRLFHLDTSPIKGIMGPVGSAKTTTMGMEIFMRAMQMPHNKRGVRYSRWAIVRDTYPNLESTTLKTWMEMFPESVFGHLYQGYPMRYPMRWNDVELDILFLAIGSETDVGKLLSLELTGIYGNELSTLPRVILERGLERTGRMPNRKEVPNYYRGIIFDTNPPPDDSWQYGFFEKEENPLAKLFKQPPGLIKDIHGNWMTNPKAENLENLPDNYYMDMVATSSAEGLKVYALGQYGSTYDGKPCYPEYNDNIHYSPTDIKADPSYPLGLGWDFAGNPSVVITQYINGQIIVLDELTSDEHSLRSFLENIVVPFVTQKYDGFSLKGQGDPSGATKPTTEGRHCFQLLEDYGLPAEPALTNTIKPRLDAVAQSLSRLVNGKPAFILSNNCKVLRKAFLGGYKFEKLRTITSDGTIRFKEQPLKNSYSHLSDALQYIALYYNSDISKDVGQFEPKTYSLNWMAR